MSPPALRKENGCSAQNSRNLINRPSSLPEGRTVANLVGQAVVRLRFQRNWTQEMLAAKMQLAGHDITRAVIANIESRRSAARDEHIIGFVKVFGVEFKDLFPAHLQRHDQPGATPPSIRKPK